MRYIKAYHGCYDPLAYPLFHPRGETGWNKFMPYNDSPTNTPSPNNGDHDHSAQQPMGIIPSLTQFIICVLYVECVLYVDAILSYYKIIAKL